MFTQYREMHGAINPAIFSNHAMFGEYLGYVGSSVRVQWAGREGAPRTQLVHGEWLTDNNPRLLMGGYILNDQAGQLGSTGAYARLASVFLLDDRDFAEGGFAAGLSFGAVQFRIDFDDVTARDEGDEVLTAGNHREVHRDVGIGIYGWKQFDGLGREDMTAFGGLSVPQAMGIDLHYRDSLGNNYGLQRVRHYYAMGGIRQGTNRNDGYLELTTWLKYVPKAPFHAEINLRYNRLMGDQATSLWIGTGYSTAQAVHAELGMMLNEDKLRIGYSFDFVTSQRILKFGNSHEVSVGYAFGD